MFSNCQKQEFRCDLTSNLVQQWTLNILFFLVFGDCLIETNLLNKNQADVFEFNNFIASVEVSVLVSPINSRVFFLFFFYITIYNYFWWFIEVKRTRNPLFDTVWITHAENSNVTMKNDTGSDDMVPNEVFHHANHKLKANVIIINIITEMSKYFFSINLSSFKLPFLFSWNNIYLNKSEHDEKHKIVHLIIHVQVTLYPEIYKI